MKFRILSPEYRMKRPRVDPTTWQVWFAWRPVRLDDYTIAWLENIARRMISATRWRKIGRTMIARPSYAYGPITHALTQPGVGLDVGQQLSPSLSTTQNSGAALQGGLMPATGYQGTAVFAPGPTNAGIAAPGGLNLTAAKPGP